MRSSPGWIRELQAWGWGRDGEGRAQLGGEHHYDAETIPMSMAVLKAEYSNQEVPDASTPT